MSLDVYDLLGRLPVMGAEEHPSAEEVVQREGGFTLKGKTFLVTGASSGIGIDTVRAFASKGARVFVLVRDVEKTKVILNEINTAFPENGGLEIIQVELDSLASVSAAAEEFLRRSEKLNVLVNNAGVMNTPYQLTKDGHEYQFGVNHLSHFLLFKKLLPWLLKSSTPDFQSRVVNVSSSGHGVSTIDLDDLHWTKRGYGPHLGYGQSKTANIYMALEIESRYGNQGLHAFAVHPGGILTGLQKHTQADIYIKRGLFNEKGEPQVPLKMKSQSQGAATTVWAAISKELEGKGGLYLEDVQISKPREGNSFAGYAPHAYDYDTARKLWEYSEKVVIA